MKDADVLQKMFVGVSQNLFRYFQNLRDFGRRIGDIGR